MKKNLLVLFFAFNCLGAYAQVLLPYSQDFGDTLFPPTGWSRFSGAGQIDTFKWIRNANVGAYGYTQNAGCAEFNNYDAPGGGTYGLHLPVMNFSDVTKPYLRFDVAYALRGPMVSDNLGIFGSIDSTVIGENLKNYSYNSLNTDTNGISINMFIPEYSQWKTVTLALSGLASRPLVRLSILDSSHNGNVLYIDNISVFDSATTGVNTINVDNKLSIYPNPFDSQINVVSNEAENIARVDISNSLGDVLVTKEVNNAGILINNLSNLPDGFYLIRIYTKEGVLNKKIVKCTGK